MISGCSVLDVSNYRVASLPLVENIGSLVEYYTKGLGESSPGEQWEQVDVEVLLGYAWAAPIDAAGGTDIVRVWAQQVAAGADPVDAWRGATDRIYSYNAVAIDKRGSRSVYH